MSHRNLFFLRFNGRNDNLGDQFIFRALVDALAPLGIVRIRGRVPAFVETARPAQGWTLALSTALARLRGYTVYTFNPPGGRLWTKPSLRKGSLQQRLRTGLFDAFGGSRVAIGTSVVPAADHSWCRRFGWIGVRDHASLAALRAAGIDSAEYFPDLSFLPPRPAPSSAMRSNVCFSFRQAVPDVSDSSRYETRLTETVDAIAGTLNHDAAIRPQFFHQVEEDREFNVRLASATSTAMHPQRLTLASFANYFSAADMVISNRLHCLLLGAFCGAVPIALTSREHTKLAALFETVGWESLIVCLDEDQSPTQQLAAVRRKLPELRSLVDETFDRQRCLGLESLDRRFGK